MSLPGLTGQSSTPGLSLLDRPVEPGDDSEVCVNPSDKPSSLEPHQAAAFALPAALLFRLALVVEFLAAAERDLDLGAPLVVEEHLERYDGHALAVDRGGELVDLATVQQELARSLRRMIEPAGLE